MTVIFRYYTCTQNYTFYFLTR